MCGHTAVLTVLVLHGITVLEEFLCVVRERECVCVCVSNLYNTSVSRCLSYIIDLRKLVFWRSLRQSENTVLMTLAYLNDNNFIATSCKYGFDNYMVNVKDAVQRNFAKSFL